MISLITVVTLLIESPGCRVDRSRWIWGIVQAGIASGLGGSLVRSLQPFSFPVPSKLIDHFGIVGFSPRRDRPADVLFSKVEKSDDDSTDDGSSESGTVGGREWVGRLDKQPGSSTRCSFPCCFYSSGFDDSVEKQINLISGIVCAVGCGWAAHADLF